MSEQEISIRPYNQDDLQRVKEITVRAWKPVYDTYREKMGEELFEAKYGDWEAHKISQVESHCETKPEHVLVSTYEATLSGYICYSVDSNSQIGVIGNNAVDPAYQGKGIATALYEHILDVFRTEEMNFAEVSTGLADAFAPARHTYEKVGFERKREFVTYWQEL